VGTHGLSEILVASPAGHVLIDGTLEGNAAQVEANIRALGFRLGDVRVILNSHAHADHAGAIARLARDSGARVLASPAAAKALAAGGDDADDPQHGEAPLFPPVAGVRALRDGEVVRLGPLALTAHFTPGHTPGGTTWTWRSCQGQTCLAIVYADSLTPFAAPGYRYGDPAHPGRVAAFRRALATVAGLPCDLLVVPHPDAIDFMEKAARRGGGADPLRQPGACRRYAGEAGAELERRLAKERAGGA
jgi:metallo-beta-lactamase class B